MLFSINNIYCQNSAIDSLKKINNINESILQGELTLKNVISNKKANEVLEVYYFLATKYMLKSDYARVDSIIDISLQISKQTLHREYEGRFYLLKANKHKYVTEYELSLENYLKAYNVFESIKSYYFMVNSTVSIGDYYRTIGKFDQGIIELNKALEIYIHNKLDYPDLLIQIYNRMAAIYNETGKFDQTIFFSNKAIEIADKENMVYEKAVSLNELGLTYKLLNKINESNIHYQQAEFYFFSISAYREGLNVLVNRAMLYSQHNMYLKEDSTLTIMHRVLTLNEKYHSQILLSPIYGVMAQYYDTHKKDYKNAFYYFKKYHDASLKDEKDKNSYKIKNIEEKYLNEKIKEELASSNLNLQQSEKENQLNERVIIISLIALGVILSLLIIILILYLKNKRTNKELEQKNKLKDTLIQEIHHRVKNNLQFVTSLINMQINSSENENEVFSLNDISRRIKSMALVHEMLYSYDETEFVKFDIYIKELVFSISELVNTNKLNIEFDIQVPDIHLSIIHATSLGMITSELISNSIKYAFDKEPQPKITIKMIINDNNETVYSVADNGIGIHYLPGQKQTKLGMRLISIFSRQIEGVYEFINKNGVTYQLKFQYHNPN